MIKEVLPFNIAFSPCCNAFSVCTSILEVASSNTRIAGSDKSVLAKEINCFCPEPSVVEIYQDDVLLERFQLSGTEHCQVLSGLHLFNADACVIRISVEEGTVDVGVLTTEAEE